MLFTNPRATIKRRVDTSTNPTSQSNMMFTKTRYVQQPTNTTANRPAGSLVPTLRTGTSRAKLPTQQPPVQKQIVTKRLAWGPPFWYLFHTIAEKVKVDRFPEIRGELLAIIMMICQNLPCPDCSKHATQYMKENRFMFTETKDGLKNILFHFHNSVNGRKGLAMFDRTELDTFYSKAMLIPVYNNFMREFTSKSRNSRMIANDFHRESIAQYVKSWFTQHTDCFDI